MNCIFIFSLSDYECYKNGSVYGYEYDQTTGNCTCKSGWQGDKCEGKLYTLNYYQSRQI